MSLRDDVPVKVLSVENILIARFFLTQTDVSRVLHDDWQRTTGEIKNLNGWTALAIYLGAFLMIAFSVSHDFLIGTSIVGMWTILSAFAAGVAFTSALQQFQVIRTRRRSVEEFWDRLRGQGLDAEVFETPGGVLLLQNGASDSLFSFFEIEELRIIKGTPRLWVVKHNDGRLGWAPESAFDSADAFDTWKKRIADRWQSEKPTGKGFEVLRR